MERSSQNQSGEGTVFGYSDWLVVADVGKSQEIYDAVASKMRLNDKVLVQEVTSDATWDKLLVSDEEFLDLLEQAR
jgi:hypothetical protein